jgi:hypothetical protein
VVQASTAEQDPGARLLGVHFTKLSLTNMLMLTASSDDRNGIHDRMAGRCAKIRCKRCNQYK